MLSAQQINWSDTYTAWDVKLQTVSAAISYESSTADSLTSSIRAINLSNVPLLVPLYNTLNSKLSILSSSLLSQTGIVSTYNNAAAIIAANMLANTNKLQAIYDDLNLAFTSVNINLSGISSIESYNLGLKYRYNNLKNIYNINLTNYSNLIADESIIIGNYDQSILDYNSVVIGVNSEYSTYTGYQIAANNNKSLIDTLILNTKALDENSRDLYVHVFALVKNEIDLDNINITTLKDDVNRAIIDFNSVQAKYDANANNYSAAINAITNIEAEQTLNSNQYALNQNSYILNNASYDQQKLKINQDSDFLTYINNGYNDLSLSSLNNKEYLNSIGTVLNTLENKITIAQQPYNVSLIITNSINELYAIQSSIESLNNQNANDYNILLNVNSNLNQIDSGYYLKNYTIEFDSSLNIVNNKKLILTLNIIDLLSDTLCDIALFVKKDFELTFSENFNLINCPVGIYKFCIDFIDNQQIQYYFNINGNLFSIDTSIFLVNT